MIKILKRIKNKITRIIKGRYISVVIPVYNCEKYIDECLQSLLNQSLKNIEIICVDDESTDNSYNILKEYEKKYKKIRVFQQPHSNAGNARNIGISKAKGKYLYFLDGDDFVNKDLCKKAYHYAKYYDLDILMFQTAYYDHQTGEFEEKDFFVNKNLMKFKKVYSSSEDLNDSIYSITTPGPINKVYKRSFVKKNGIKYQPLTNSNDLYFTRVALALATRIMAIDETLSFYRVNHGNNTQFKKYKEPLNFIKGYIKVKETLEEKGLFDRFYKTFVNTIVGEVVYNYETTKTDEGKEKIIKYLKEEGLKKLGIKKINEKDIINKKRYESYKEIMNK